MCNKTVEEVFFNENMKLADKQSSDVIKKYVRKLGVECLEFDRYSIKKHFLRSNTSVEMKITAGINNVFT